MVDAVTYCPVMNDYHHLLWSLLNTFFACDFQLNGLQDQVASLKTSNEHLQKQNEDMISKLKEVCV